MAHREPVTTQEEPTIGKLVVDASRDVSALIKGEIELAKSELKVSLRFGAIGAGLLGAAAFLGLLGVIMFSVTFAYLLRLTGLNLAWCFGIVTIAYLALAGILGLVGVRKFKKVKAPERAIEQGKQIPAAFKGNR
jgi:hypothetical protein